MVGSADIGAVRRADVRNHMNTAGSKACSQALPLHSLYPFPLCPSVTSPLCALKRVPECMSTHVRVESIIHLPPSVCVCVCVCVHAHVCVHRRLGSACLYSGSTYSCTGSYSVRACSHPLWIPHSSEESVKVENIFLRNFSPLTCT